MKAENAFSSTRNAIPGTYRRIVAYLLLYCEKKKYHSVNELIPGDIRDFILHLYDHGYFKPSTITSGLSGLKRFLSLYPQIKHLSIELPSHLPRERKIMEIYSEDERAAINSVLSEDNNLTKRDKAISLLLLETGLKQRNCTLNQHSEPHANQINPNIRYQSPSSSITCKLSSRKARVNPA